MSDKLNEPFYTAYIIYLLLDLGYWGWSWPRSSHIPGTGQEGLSHSRCGYQSLWSRKHR